MSFRTGLLPSMQLLLLLALGSEQPVTPAESLAKPQASICIAPFHVPVGGDALEPIMSQTTWPPSEDSRFEFRIHGTRRATVTNGEMASISGLPTDRRIRVTVSLDGRPFESLSLDLRHESEHRICLWLYPGYWHWINNGWQEKLGCRCKPALHSEDNPGA
jgi:hypothetical protein